VSDIAPRPWKASESYDEGRIEDANGNIVVHDDGTPTGDEAKHIVNCVNAIHAAGITPEALVRDPECVKKFVDAVLALTDPEDHIYHGRSGECTGECRDIRAALSACGIKIKTYPPRRRHRVMPPVTYNARSPLGKA
jgi:hypothetical protein